MYRYGRKEGKTTKKDEDKRWDWKSRWIRRVVLPYVYHGI